MFARKTKDPDIETLIGAGTRVDGDVRVTRGMHVEGRVHGNVVAEPGGAPVLEIAQGGVVEGNVDVPRVIVHGEVRGDIRASVQVELGATARVSGSVVYGVIEMAAGAVIHGRLVAAALAEGGAAEPTEAPPPAAAGR
jgi:cytoskeletal protein CcmA (bactofilin family)